MYKFTGPKSKPIFTVFSDHTSLNVHVQAILLLFTSAFRAGPPAQAAVK
jgi:hypothetical protein